MTCALSAMPSSSIQRPVGEDAQPQSWDIVRQVIQLDAVLTGQKHEPH